MGLPKVPGRRRRLARGQETESNSAASSGLQKAIGLWILRGRIQRFRKRLRQPGDLAGNFGKRALADLFQFPDQSTADDYAVRDLAQEAYLLRLAYAETNADR